MQKDIGSVMGLYPTPLTIVGELVRTTLIKFTILRQPQRC